MSGLVTFEGNGEGDDSPDYHGQGKWRPLVASSGGWLGTAPSFQANSFSQDCCVITSEVLGDIRLRESSAGAQWSVTRSYSDTSMPHQQLDGKLLSGFVQGQFYTGYILLSYKYIWTG